MADATETLWLNRWIANISSNREVTTLLSLDVWADILLVLYTFCRHDF